LLREILNHLQAELESGTPIVVLEPSLRFWLLELRGCFSR
jgi:hypothetical protein